MHMRVHPQRSMASGHLKIKIKGLTLYFYWPPGAILLRVLVSTYGMHLYTVLPPPRPPPGKGKFTDLMPPLWYFLDESKIGRHAA